MEKITGRESERALLAKIIKSAEPELVAVYGRRRVGKTFLIRNVFEKQLVFEFSGIHNASFEQQLENFTEAVSKAAGLRLSQPTGWIQAFKMLTDYVSPIIQKK